MSTSCNCTATWNLKCKLTFASYIRGSFCTPLQLPKKQKKAPFAPSKGPVRRVAPRSRKKHSKSKLFGPMIYTTVRWLRKLHPVAIAGRLPFTCKIRWTDATCLCTIWVACSVLIFRFPSSYYMQVCCTYPRESVRLIFFDIMRLEWHHMQPCFMMKLLVSLFATLPCSQIQLIDCFITITRTRK